jgi:hypothetical protein
MAYLTFDPSSEELEGFLVMIWHLLNEVLNEELPKLGVSEGDVAVRTLKCNTRFSSTPHVEVTLKTDNELVTADKIVELIDPVCGFPFEVSRIFVGNKGNWASNNYT